MLDYKLLEALEAVSSAGSFDAAARRLHLTQSAVSQRIRQLEERCGMVLLVRDTPVRATPAGQKLLAHVRQVQLLEADLQGALALAEPQEGWLSLRVGVNADSLALGLVASITPDLQAARILLDCVVADEEDTLDELRRGEVVGCIASHAQAVGGCAVQALGRMPYCLVASPEFVAREFADGVNATTLAQAPAAVFGQQDSIHRRWLREHWQLEQGAYPCLVIPDSTALFGAVRAGLAYGVLPQAQVAPEIASGRLLDLTATPVASVPLYWHHWARPSQSARELARALQRWASNTLEAFA